MDAAVITFILIGLAVGAIIGWLVGSRAAAASKQVTESLRLQLDEVVRERDANRTAAQDLAALKAAQEEREKAPAEGMGLTPWDQLAQVLLSANEFAFVD